MNQCSFILEGKFYQEEYLDMINNAHNEIIIQSYIFKMDRFGSEVFNALLDRSKTGVKVKILIDAFGSGDFPKDKRELIVQNYNMELVFFNSISLKRFLKMGRRLHHKILMIDAKSCIIGGINIVDFEFANQDNFPRLDFAIKLVDYNLDDIRSYCLQLHYSVLRHRYIRKHLRIKNLEYDDIKVLTNDWLLSRYEIQNQYIKNIKNAKESITLVHGYFFPSMKVLKLLRKKARQGIEVKLLLPVYSDWTSWIWATKHLYKYLFDSKVKIMVWEKSNLHGKLGIFDGKLILVGSHNLNYTSSFGNLEMNVQISDKELCLDISRKINELISIGASEYETESNLLSPLKKIRNYIFYIILSFAALFTINTLGLAKRIKK